MDELWAIILASGTKEAKEAETAISVYNEVCSRLAVAKSSPVAYTPRQVAVMIRSKDELQKQADRLFHVAYEAAFRPIPTRESAEDLSRPYQESDYMPPSSEPSWLGYPYEINNGTPESEAALKKIEEYKRLKSVLVDQIVQARTYPQFQKNVKEMKSRVDDAFREATMFFEAAKENQAVVRQAVIAKLQAGVDLLPWENPADVPFGIVPDSFGDTLNAAWDSFARERSLVLAKVAAGEPLERYRPHLITVYNELKRFQARYAAERSRRA